MRPPIRGGGKLAQSYAYTTRAMWAERERSGQQTFQKTLEWERSVERGRKAAEQERSGERAKSAAHA